MKTIIMSLASLAMIIPYAVFTYAFQNLYPGIFIPVITTMLILIPVMLLSMKGAEYGMLSGFVFSLSEILYSLPAVLIQPHGYGLPIAWGLPINTVAGGVGARGLGKKPKRKFLYFFSGAVAVQFILRLGFEPVFANV
nr:hypothetical protein 12 [bacterium]